MPDWHEIQSNGAGDGSRTRDLKLGKLALFQLSYTRNPLIWLTLFRISVKGVFFLKKALQKCKNPSEISAIFARSGCP